VQEQRRHDLIGSLVTVVKQYAAYEQQLQTASAAIRAHGPLPTDAEVQAATTQDASARAQAAQLLAVGEANPELHANEQFAKLHDALTDTENRIAFARQFYNDAVNVMRDRSQTFPYSLYTSLVPMPSLRLFGEGAAPARPAPVGAISS
jgi:LemA protein